MAEFISVTWLSQQIFPEMSIEDAIDVIANAPVVDIDVELLHDIETARGRRKNRVEWALNTAEKLCGDEHPSMLPLLFEKLVSYGKENREEAERE